MMPKKKIEKKRKFKTNSVPSNSSKVIKNDNNYPFFQLYHNASYIVSHDKRKTISLKDSPQSGKSGTGNGNYILENDNKHEIVVYRIDGGILSESDGNKCDYAIYTEKKKLILIELKGGALREAINQIDSTITTLLTSKLDKYDTVHARIVTSKYPCPNITTKYTFELKKRIIRLKGELKIRARMLRENVSDL